MPDVPVWLVVLGAAVGYALSYGQNRIARRANVDTVATAGRKEILDTYRWAAELAADQEESKRQLGIRTLARLAERSDVTREDRQLILAALDVTLAAVGPAWNTAQEAGDAIEPVSLDQDAAPLDGEKEE